MALSLLQDSHPGKGLVAVARHHGLSHCRIKEEEKREAMPAEPNDNNNTTSRTNFTAGLLASGPLFPSALINPLNLQASLASNPALFHSNPLLQWAANRMAATQSPATKKWSKKRKKEEAPIELSTPPSPPTSGSSPQSNGSVHDVITAKPSAADKQAAREKVFVCRICNHSFGYKHVLQNHERTHTGEKPFECPECHRRFTRDHHLKIHMRLHTGEKPYHCPHCDKHFVQVANLRRHLRVHTGERPYACQLCSSRFSDSNQLKAHTLIHRGEKPFECGTCGVRFRRRHHLLHHKCHGGSDHEEIVVDYEDEYEEEHPKKSRERKSREVRRVIREPLLTIPIILPEQTEPEDLSMAARHKNNNNNSGISESDEPLHDPWLKHRLIPSPTLS